jgi:hypothetical protein
MKFRRRIKTLAVAGLAFGAACTDSPTVPQSVETEGAEALFFNSNRALAALASEREPRDHDDLAEFPETVAGLDFGECLVEYRRADDRVTAVVVQVLGVGEERDTDPFMVRYRTKKGRFLYSATCDVPEDARDAAMDRISWAPGHGENAAGKGWDRDRDDTEREERRGTSSLSRGSEAVGLVIGTRLGPLDEIRVMSIVWANYSQYDWCWVIFDEGGVAIGVTTCGMNSTPGGEECGGGTTFDALVDKCIGSGGGSGPGNNTPPPCIPEQDADCEQPLTVTDELVLDAAMGMRNDSIQDSTIRATCDRMFNDFVSLRAQGRVLRGGSNTTLPDSAHSGAFSPLSENVHFDPSVLDNGATMDLRWLADILSTGMHEAAHWKDDLHGPKRPSMAPFTFPVEYDETPFSYLGRKMAESCIDW